jgi:hypothetical protein
MCSCMANEHEQSHSSWFHAAYGCLPVISYPWLRVHMLFSFSTFTLFSVLDLVFTSVLHSQIRFTSAVYPRTLAERSFKVVSEK